MFKKIHFPTVDSTHKWALRELSLLTNDYFSIFTDHQTAGIGRKGHPWFSTPNQNITCTLVFPVPQTPDLANLAQLFAYSTIKTLEELGFHPLFKWPNDLHLNQKKIGGILCEIKDDLVILSLGLNVNMRNAALSPIDQPATSLHIETQQEYSVTTLYDHILQTFSIDLSLFQQEGFAPFFNDFASHLAFIGKKVSVNEATGIIGGLNRDGRLILNVNGKKRLISSGSLELLDNDQQ